MNTIMVRLLRSHAKEAIGRCTFKALPEHRKAMEAEMRESFRELGPDSTAEQVWQYTLMSPNGSSETPWTFLLTHTRIFASRRSARFAGKAGAAFWRWLPMHWSGFDAIPHDFYEAWFREYRNDWTPDRMSSVPEDPDQLSPRAAYDALPDHGISIYRGQGLDHEPGLSWTLNRKVAEGFARGHRGFGPRNPGVLEAEIEKADIAFMATDRGEDEVVLFEPPAEFDEQKMNLKIAA
jgi:hypothetical protein